jgi:formylglycine-generating enzyme required for sulfatase activity
VKDLDTSRFPAESISFTECEGFVDQVNGYEKKKFKKVKLPTEDEWEYACRGGKGNQRPFYWGDSLNGNKANCNGNYPYGTETKGTYKERIMAVGSFEKLAPHPWGLCDMSGNVYQWCDRWYDSEQKFRVLRGGSWSCRARLCRSADRNGNEPSNRSDGVGFRLALLD